MLLKTLKNIANKMVLIKRKYRTVFELREVLENRSPLDVKGVNLNLGREEILEIQREVRNR